MQYEVNVDFCLHEVRHVAEERSIRLVFSLLHHARVLEHLGKDGVLVDSPVLHSATPLPYDLLVLLETTVQQIYLNT